MAKTFFRADFADGAEYRSSENRSYGWASKLPNGAVSFHGERHNAPVGAEVVPAVQVDAKLARITMDQISLHRRGSVDTIARHRRRLEEYTARSKANPGDRLLADNVRWSTDSLAEAQATNVKLLAHIAKHGDLT